MASKKRKKTNTWYVYLKCFYECVNILHLQILFYFVYLFQRRAKQIKELTHKLLELDSELTPMAFLRQLAFENADLTDQFSKFYKQAPDSSGSESSDDECDLTAHTQTTTSSQRTLSQMSVNSHEMDGIEQMAGSSFEQANEDQPNVDSHMNVGDELAQFLFDNSNENQPTIDTSMHVDDISAESSFENSNVVQPTVNASIHRSPLPSTSNVPANVNIPAGCVLRPFSIVAPSVQEAMNKMKKEKEEKQKAEDERQQKLRAILETLEVPEPKRGDCTICAIEVPCNIALSPCGHTCCLSCWQKDVDMYKEKCEKADLSPEEIALKIKEPPCMFCRRNVTGYLTIFFRNFYIFISD